MMKMKSFSTERKRKSQLSECQICGSPAFHSYYGVISCQACKVFFKRHAQFGKVWSIIAKIIHMEIVCLEWFEMSLS